jgi:hypothetical protein
MSTYGNERQYTDPISGQTYNVKFDIKVHLLDKSKETKEKVKLARKEGSFNVVKLGDHDNNSKTYSTGYGNMGFWDDNKQNQVRSHEFGHMLGFDESYYIKENENKQQYAENYDGVSEDNIMGKNANNPNYNSKKSGKLKLSQTQINDIAGYAIKNQNNGKGRLKFWQGKAINYSLPLGKPSVNQNKKAESDGKVIDKRK